jgi:hypothetical protein
MAGRGTAFWLSAPALLLPVGTAAASDIEDLYNSLAAGCWVCGPFDRIADAGLTLSQQVFAAVCGEASALLGLLMGTWLILFAVRTALPFGPQHGSGTLWAQVARKLLRFAVVLGLLQGGQAFWDYIFTPTVAAAAGLSIQLTSLVSGQTCASGPIGSGISGATAAIGLLDCPLSAIQGVFGKGVLTGLAIILGAGWHDWVDFLKIWDWPGQVVQVIAGLALAAVYAFGFLVFPLLLVDALARAILVATFAPLVIVAAQFGPTAEIARKALWMLAQAAITMLFASTAAGIAAAVLQHASAALPAAGTQQSTAGAALIQAIESGSVKLTLIDQAYWAQMAVGVIVIFMLRRAGHMAAWVTGVAVDDVSGARGAVAALAGGAVQLAAGATQATAASAARSLAGKLRGGR